MYLFAIHIYSHIQRPVMEIEITTIPQGSDAIGLMTPAERERYLEAIRHSLDLPEAIDASITYLGLESHRLSSLSEKHELLELSARQALELGGSSLYIIQPPLKTDHPASMIVQPISNVRTETIDDPPTTHMAPAERPTEIINIAVADCSKFPAAEMSRVFATAREVIGSTNPSDVLSSGCSTIFPRGLAFTGPRLLELTRENITILEDALWAYWRARFSGGATQISAWLTQTNKQLRGIINDRNPTWSPTTAQISVLEEIVEALETLTLKKLATEYHIAFEADVLSAGLTEIYWSMVVSGLSSPRTLELLEYQKHVVATQRFVQKIKAVAILEKARISAVKAIIEQKFGKKSLRDFEDQVSANPSKTTSLKELMSLLPAVQSKIIAEEYDRREKRISAVLTNKCPHVAVLSKYRRAPNEHRARELWKTLSDFFEKESAQKQPSRMIECSACHLDILCPHVVELVEADADRESFSAIRNRMSKYIDTSTKTSAGYFCKICGETLTGQIESDDLDMTASSGVMNDELRSELWGEANHVLNQVSASGIFNVKSFIGALTRKCYPAIYEITKQLAKARTSSAEAIAGRRQLYISIYAYAYVIHFMKTNPQFYFRDFKKGASVPEAIKYAVGRILTAKNVILRGMPDITSENIMNNIVGAYRQLVALPQHTIGEGLSSETSADILDTDPIYHYLFRYHLVQDISSGKINKSAVSKINPLSWIDKLLGVPENKLAKAKNVFGKIDIPKLDTSNPPEAKYPLVYPGKPTNSAGSASLKAWIAKQSFAYFAKYVQRGSYEEYGQESLAADEFREAHWLMHGAVFTKQLQEQLDAVAPIIAAENKYLTTRKWENIKPTGNIYRAPHKQPDVESSISRLYDTEGRPHKFDIIITEKGETTRAEIAKNLTLGVPVPQEILDSKCSTCGILKSEVESLDPKVVLEAIAEATVIGNFFRFYEFRCPEGAFHEYAKGICEKCNMSTSMFTNSNNTPAKEIYAKYAEVWDDEKKMLKPPETIRIVGQIAPPADFSSKFETWVYSTTAVLELAEKVSVDAKYLLSLGGMEKHTFEEMPEFVDDLPEPEYMYDSRAYRVSAYVMKIITSYLGLRGYFEIIKPLWLVKSIVDASKLTGDSLQKEISSLPSINTDYLAEFKWVRTNRSPKTTLEFALHSLCTILLNVWSDSAVAQAFVRGMVNYIMNSEEVLSKPGYFNWGLVFGVQQTPETQETKTIYGEDTTENDPTEDKDPMSIAALDVDVDPDDDMSDEAVVNFRSVAIDG